jgi:hypothetical protein
MTKKDSFKLPKNQLVFLKNKDKDFHEKWYQGRNLLNIPHPFRALLFGSPNSGKTNMIFNLIMRANPPFQKIYILHPDPDSKEYSVLDDNCVMLNEIPEIDFCDPDCKNLLIVDDIELKTLKKQEKARLDRICSYSSTHRNLSICCTSQDCFNVPPTIRRSANIFFLYKNVPDLSSLATVASRTGLNSTQLFNIFSLCDNIRDCLCIDLTPNSPARLRLNGFKKVDKNVRGKFYIGDEEDEDDDDDDDDSDQ